ncbi:MAG: hypothetical protein RQM92_17600 [Candidatus Syntrophopropionicum ammoniitolerans]
MVWISVCWKALMNRLPTGWFDLTIILSFCAGDGIDRIKRSGRPIDRIEREAAAFHMRVGPAT